MNFKSVKELCDYRLNLTYKQIDLDIVIEKYSKEYLEYSNIVTSLINNNCYNEIIDTLIKKNNK